MASVETPTELFVHKLGAALTMEETILEMLEQLRDEASDSKLKQDLQRHRQETQQQVQNLHRIFDALGERAEQLDDDDIVALLQENLEQEEAALDKAVKAAEQSSRQLVEQYS